VSANIFLGNLRETVGKILQRVFPLQRLKKKLLNAL